MPILPNPSEGERTVSPETGAAFDKFLLEEGLLLIQAFKSIRAPGVRRAVLELVVIIQDSLSTSTEAEAKEL